MARELLFVVAEHLRRLGFPDCGALLPNSLSIQLRGQNEAALSALRDALNEGGYVCEIEYHLNGSFYYLRKLRRCRPGEATFVLTEKPPLGPA